MAEHPHRAKPIESAVNQAGEQIINKGLNQLTKQYTSVE
jgi:hypothetical protein